MKRREIGAGRNIEFVRDGKNHEQEKSGADQLVDKTGLRKIGEGGECSEDAGGLFELGIELMKGGQKCKFPW
jgi:hypothetical protein